MNRSHIIALLFLVGCRAPAMEMPGDAGGSAGSDAGGGGGGGDAGGGGSDAGGGGGGGSIACKQWVPPSVPWPVTGSSPSSAVVMDLDGDGQLDLVTANSGDHSVSVLLGRGKGAFQARVDYPLAGSGTAVAAADLNGDGKPDIVVTSTGNGDVVSVLLGRGDGTLQPRSDFPAPLSLAFAVADVNRDGKLDVAVTGADVGSVSVLLGNGDGTLQPKVDVPIGQDPLSIAIADVNGDGKPDLIVGDTTTKYVVGALLGNGDGTFQPQIDSSSTAIPNAVMQATAIAVGDIDGDGKLDMIAVADMTGDGTLDLVVTSRDTSTVSVLAGTGHGTFERLFAFPVASGPSAVAAADVTGTARPTSWWPMAAPRW